MAGKQYTIRGIPEELDSVLREEATRYGKSMNALLIDKLTEACSIADKPKTNGLEIFSGCMKPDPELEAALWEQRVVDPRDWE
jgi:hypothetical protein